MVKRAAADGALLLLIVSILIGVTIAAVRDIGWLGTAIAWISVLGLWAICHGIVALARWSGERAAYREYKKRVRDK